MTKQIPDSLRQKLSEAGKKGNAALTREQKALGGKRSWQTRVKKAKEAEKAAAT
jgi:hypothetical protein